MAAESSNVISGGVAFDSLHSEVFEDVSTIVIDFLSDQNANKAELLFKKIDEFAQRHETNSEDVKNSVKNLIILATDYVAKGRELRTELRKTGISDSKVEIFAQKFEENQSEITKVMLSQMLTINKLVDMEWKFGVTVASSERHSVGSTFIQLKLVVDKGSGDLENVYMELTLPQFYSFLHEMERAKMCMEQQFS